MALPGDLGDGCGPVFGAVGVVVGDLGALATGGDTLVGVLLLGCVCGGALGLSALVRTWVWAFVDPCVGWMCLPDVTDSDTSTLGVFEATCLAFPVSSSNCLKRQGLRTVFDEAQG